MARDDSWYIGVDAGVLLVEDQNMTFSAVPAGGRAAPSIDYHKGYDVDANIGYDFGGFRLEAEAAYKRAKIDLDKTGFGGAASALSFMLNGLLDFGPDDGLQGFVGGGVGVSRGKVASDIVNDSDTGFAWQALAGVRYPVTNNVDVSLKYRRPPTCQPSRGTTCHHGGRGRCPVAERCPTPSHAALRRRSGSPSRQ